MQENEINYINAMAQAKQMLKQDLITKTDFEKIEKHMAKKYALGLSLYRHMT